MVPGKQGGGGGIGQPGRIDIGDGDEDGDEKRVLNPAEKPA